MTGTTVSVVIPAFNRAAFVGEAIASLQEQIGPEGEIVVVDDGSTDETPAVVAAIAAGDARVRLLRLPHGGVARARNAGIDAARGRWITFLDSDDICAPGRIPRQIAKLEAGPDLAAVVGELVLFEAMSPDFRPLDGSRWERVMGISLTTATFRTAALRAVGPVNEALGQGEDLDLYLRLLEGGARFLIEIEPAVYYRRHASNLTNDEAAMRQDVMRAYVGSRMRQRRRGLTPIIDTFFFKEFDAETEFAWPGVAGNLAHG
jgi:glycosyltransferase involved in cell wall biosynthesis